MYHHHYRPTMTAVSENNILKQSQIITL